MLHTKLQIVLAMCLLSATIAAGQVTGIAYKIDYNNSTDLYDCKIVVTAGATSTNAISRIQANAQYSIVVPTGSLVQIAELHMPLVGNVDYEGTQPMDWEMTNQITAPLAQDQSDYYSIIPRLAPAAYYNNLAEGDEVTLFSLQVESADACSRNVRPFNKELDPQAVEAGMMGADFRNGMTIGSPIQLYVGNAEPSESMEAAMTDHLVCPGECTMLSTDISCMAYPIKYQWDTGETSSQIEVCPMQDTNYTLTVTDGNGSSTVSTVTVYMDTSADTGCITATAFTHESPVAIYPNPTLDVLTVEAKSGIVNVHLYDITGREQALDYTLIKGSTCHTSMTGLAAGHYLLHLETQTGTSINKILKL